ncbi:MAG: 3D domain-containing protein [Phycisphaerae bacterium]
MSRSARRFMVVLAVLVSVGVLIYASSSSAYTQPTGTGDSLVRGMSLSAVTHETTTDADDILHLGDLQEVQVFDDPEIVDGQVAAAVLKGARLLGQAPEPTRPRSPQVAYSAPKTVTLRMRVTGYCPCRRCCGRHADGITASGKNIYAHGSKFVAADTRLLPFGTRISIPGYNGGAPVPVYDRGGKIKGNRLDLFYLSHHTARRWGVQYLDVTVYVDSLPEGFDLSRLR